MANEITLTQADSIVPERWRPRFINALYEPHDITPHVLNVTDDFGGVGDIAHIATEPTYTVNNVGSDGALTVQQPTLTNVNLTVDKNKDITVEFTGITRKQAYKIWEEQFPISAGNAMREQIQSDLLGLYGDVTSTASGDGLGNLGEDEYLNAVQVLVTAKVNVLKNPEECCFALHTSQFAAAKKLNLLSYDKTGEAGMGGAATIKLHKLWDIPVVFTTQVTSASSIRQNMLFHKTAFAWAVQRNVEPRMADRLAAAKDSYLMTVLALYGVKTVLGARANVLKSKA